MDAFIAQMPDWFRFVGPPARAARRSAAERRLVVLGRFFRFARTRKIVLVDPARGLTATGPSGFTGTTLTLDQQRLLFRRWTTDPAVHPHEALRACSPCCRRLGRQWNAAWPTVKNRRRTTRM
ncbi:hypothetical protein [Streptomyces sp. NPDC006335]|uniref:hypothetical protein n=1 Tax=Streptomyces sp. NPDC006335 TaxID=3156895 RepID=UPI0033BE58DC